MKKKLLLFILSLAALACIFALSVSAATDEDAAEALACLPELRGCQAHISVIPSDVDKMIYSKLGIHLTVEPEYENDNLLFYRKTVFRARYKLLAGRKSAVKEVFVVYSVGHGLSLQAERVAALLGLSAAEGIFLIPKEVSAVKLNAGTVGKYLHNDASVGRDNGSSFLNALASFSKNEAMVDSAADNDILVIISLKSLGNEFELGKIKRRTFDRLYLTRGDERIISGQISVGVNKYLVCSYIALARKIEVCVVGEVKYGLFVGGSAIRDLESPLRCKRVCNRHGKRAGVALLTVGRYGIKGNGIVRYGSRPELFIKAALTTVKVIHTVVYIKRVVNAVKSKLAAAYSVSYSSYNRAEISLRALIRAKRIISANGIFPARAMSRWRFAIF